MGALGSGLMSQQVPSLLSVEASIQLLTDDTRPSLNIPVPVQQQYESIGYGLWRTTEKSGGGVQGEEDPKRQEVSEEAPSRNLTELQGEPQRAKEEV